MDNSLSVLSSEYSISFKLKLQQVVETLNFIVTAIAWLLLSQVEFNIVLHIVNF